MDKNIIKLDETVTKNKLDTVLIINSIAIQLSQKKLAVRLVKAMNTEDGILYGQPFQGAIDISIEGVEAEHIESVLELIKKAELKLRSESKEKNNLSVNINDL